MAPVFAANVTDPEQMRHLAKKERGAFENLIMLCPLCHTIVDKAPSVYSDRVILGWKQTHAEKLRSLFGVTQFEKRSDARAAIEGLLRENRQVFDDHGAHIEEAKNPESGAAERWKRKVLHRIFPNSRRILSHLDTNRHLLNDRELVTPEKFRQHIDDLEARHIEGYREGASRFPADIPDILRT